MPDTLVDCLRAAAGWVDHQTDPAPDWDALLTEAADEIERLRRLADERGREIERLQNEADGLADLLEDW